MLNELSLERILQCLLEEKYIVKLLRLLRSWAMLVRLCMVLWSADIRRLMRLMVSERQSRCMVGGLGDPGLSGFVVPQVLYLSLEGMI